MKQKETKRISLEKIADMVLKERNIEENLFIDYKQKIITLNKPEHYDEANLLTEVYSIFDSNKWILKKNYSK